MDKSKQENSKLQHAIKENLEEIDNLKDEKLSLELYWFVFKVAISPDFMYYHIFFKMIIVFNA
jgi:ribosome-binding factor A